MDGTSRAPSRPANALSAGAVKRAEKERRGEAHSQGAETGAISCGDRAISRAPSRPARNLSAGVEKRNEKEGHGQGADPGAFSSGVKAPSPAADKRPYDADADLFARSGRLFAQSFPTPIRGPRITPEVWLASTRAKGMDTEITRAIALAQKNVTAALAPQFGCGSSGWQPMAGEDIGRGTKPAETTNLGVNKGKFETERGMC